MEIQSKFRKPSSKPTSTTFDGQWVHLKQHWILPFRVDWRSEISWIVFLNILLAPSCQQLRTGVCFDCWGLEKELGSKYRQFFDMAKCQLLFVVISIDIMKAYKLAYLWLWSLAWLCCTARGMLYRNNNWIVCPINKTRVRLLIMSLTLNRSGLRHHPIYSILEFFNIDIENIWRGLPFKSFYNYFK